MRLSSAIHLTRTALQPLQKNAWIKSTCLPKARVLSTPLYRHGWQPSTIRMTTTANIPTDSTTADSKPKRILYGGWIDKLPEKWAPYAFLARIDKPIGTWLLFWPCAWSATMAAYSHHFSEWDTAVMIAAMGFGAVAMRGAGCTINDLWDRNMDNKVERTKIRPVAAGTVTVPQAIAFTGAQMFCALGTFMMLNNYTKVLSLSSLALVVTYPLMKRVTYWPQVVLGLAFNYGALVGWSAMTGSLDYAVCAPLYLGGVAWTLTYDTIYAHQDKRDDVLAGVKSTALRFGDKTPQWLTGFSSAFVGLTALAGYMNGQGLPFYLISVGGTAAHLAWQLRTVNYDDPKSCWQKFASNKQIGAIVWSGLLADTALAASYVA
ncbi:4-hydroxybenzoate polyprenyl transferase [Lichtheimia ornata]|uniref:4-hydroxybenzoate polyprenyltransferase, mitochondrial n=1 Tax=Lichtheimia ornata TaxID=688661 RepID=A0AAD7UQV0_9FUNG|nr:4-hydroxybenzoate polyprenyl transferase [Lichtheimia ornata]KAJ8651505.1 4-hydroxybenzoate polyprenyl transferase [Lichtheimia ornata]